MCPLLYSIETHKNNYNMENESLILMYEPKEFKALDKEYRRLIAKRTREHMGGNLKGTLKILLPSLLMIVFAFWGIGPFVTAAYLTIGWYFYLLLSIKKWNRSCSEEFSFEDYLRTQNCPEEEVQTMLKKKEDKERRDERINTFRNIWSALLFLVALIVMLV